MVIAIIACILVFCSMGFYASYLSFENNLLKIEKQQNLSKIKELGESVVDKGLELEYWKMKWLEAMDHRYDYILKKDD